MRPFLEMEHIMYTFRTIMITETFLSQFYSCQDPFKEECKNILESCEVKIIFIPIQTRFSCTCLLEIQRIGPRPKGKKGIEKGIKAEDG